MEVGEKIDRRVINKNRSQKIAGSTVNTHVTYFDQIQTVYEPKFGIFHYSLILILDSDWKPLLPSNLVPDVKAQSHVSETNNTA